MPAPPPDAPPPSVQDQQTADATFGPGPSASSLCAFPAPPNAFSLLPKIPSLGFPPPLPVPVLAIAFNCDLDNPLAINNALPASATRVPQVPPDPDDDYDTL